MLPYGVTRLQWVNHAGGVTGMGAQLRFTKLENVFEFELVGNFSWVYGDLDIDMGII